MDKKKSSYYRWVELILAASIIPMIEMLFWVCNIKSTGINITVTALSTAAIVFGVVKCIPLSKAFLTAAITSLVSFVCQSTLKLGIIDFNPILTEMKEALTTVRSDEGNALAGLVNISSMFSRFVIVISLVSIVPVFAKDYHLCTAFIKCTVQRDTNLTKKWRNLRKCFCISIALFAFALVGILSDLQKMAKLRAANSVVSPSFIVFGFVVLAIDIIIFAVTKTRYLIYLYKTSKSLKESPAAGKKTHCRK